MFRLILACGLATAALSCNAAYGSYQETCKDCRTDTKCFIHCQCAGYGKYWDTSYDLSVCNHLVNTAGNLECHALMEGVEFNTTYNRNDNGDDEEGPRPTVEAIKQLTEEQDAMGMNFKFDTEAPTCTEAYGSYQQTCKDCRIDSKCFIHCQCAGYGKYHDTSYDLNTCNHLVNTAGNLECYAAEKEGPNQTLEASNQLTEEQDAMGESLKLDTEAPSCTEAYGSYEQTCKDCRIDSNCFIHCQCAGYGTYHDTSYDLNRCNHLVNTAGNLECYAAEEKGPNQTLEASNQLTEEQEDAMGESLKLDTEQDAMGDSPTFDTGAPSCTEAYGSYEQTCKDCRIDSNCFIHCQCAGYGKYHDTSYDLNRCNHLVNTAGNLECYAVSAAVVV